MKSARHLVGRVIAWSQQPARKAAKPAVHAFHREVREARRANDQLTNAQAAAAAAAALAVVVLAVAIQAMLVSKYSAMDSSDFQHYHPLTPWLGLAGSILYLMAIYLKGVTYWLPYVPAAATSMGSFVLLLLIHGALHPTDLDWFPDAPSWWQGT